MSPREWHVAKRSCIREWHFAKRCCTGHVAPGMAFRQEILHWAFRPGTGISPKWSFHQTGHFANKYYGIWPRDLALGISPRGWHFATRSCTGHFALGQAFRQNGHFANRHHALQWAFRHETLQWALRPVNGIAPIGSTRGDGHFAPRLSLRQEARRFPLAFRLETGMTPRGMAP